MGPNGSENFKTLLPQIAAKVFKIVLNFPPNGPHKKTTGGGDFEFRFSTIFFSDNFKFIIVAYGEIKTSFIWKKSNRRAKWSEIWDLWVVVQHIWVPLVF